MSKLYNITVIVGVSGVGKTFLINKLIKNDSQFIHFSAGSLIQKRLSVINRDRLRLLSGNQILQNQYAMLEQFNIELQLLPIPRHVLFDAHMIIDSGIDLIEIPFEIFRGLSPCRIVFLHDDPKFIVERRNLDVTRDRPEKTVFDISQQQARSKELAVELCNYLSVPLISVSESEDNDVREMILA